MICYNCGTRLKSGETTCPACGKKQMIPQSLLDGAKKGDRSSIVGLYNYSYASVYETVEVYLSDEDEIQNMIRDVYIEAFRRIQEISRSGEFRAFLTKIARNKMAGFTPAEKEESPGWLIIPETQTLRQILSNVAEQGTQQAHRSLERQAHQLEKMQVSESAERRERQSVERQERQSAERQAHQRLKDQEQAHQSAESQTQQPLGTQPDGADGESIETWWKDMFRELNEQEEARKADDIAGKSSSDNSSNKGAGSNFDKGSAGNASDNAGAGSNNSNSGVSGENQEDTFSGSMEEELRRVASSANEDWASLGFTQPSYPSYDDDSDLPEKPSRMPLILGIILAAAAVIVVIILVVAAFGNGQSSDSENRSAETSESRSQEETESQPDSETESGAALVDSSENIAGTEDMTEDVTETETESEIEVDPTGNILMSDDVPLDEADAAVFGNENLMRSEIGTVTILDTLEDAPEDAWDVSEGSDGLVMAWVIYDESSDLYDLYVAGEGGIYANENSAYLFASYVSATFIDFGGCFHTDSVTDMSGMFYECASLESLDLSGFDTSEVTNMSYMFYDCVSLAEVDLSSFDTSEVTAMSYMFTACESLTGLSISGFDFANVTDMEYMLAGCSSLETLDIDSTSAASDANSEGMYEGTAFE